MSAYVAEYLGVNVDADVEIKPLLEGAGTIVPCPFRAGHCDKVKVGNKPICSVRDGAGVLWMVCQHRLCATSPKSAPLTEYQTDVLVAIAKTIWRADVDRHDVAVRREVPVRTPGRPTSRADYVMLPTPELKRRDTNGSIAQVVLEMQGGGETSNTGELTAQVSKWEIEVDAHRNRNTLTTPLPNVGTLETNAWRRQQEQFLFKGNVAVNSFGRLVFAVGSKLYDYLLNNLSGTAMQDLRGANWSLALVGISEDTSNSPESFGADHSVRLKIDEQRLLFTSYPKFVQALTNQGGIDPDLFKGDFVKLDGTTMRID
jgi:hypothetical protein